MNWYESTAIWLKGFLSDSKTGKASLTALLKLFIMIVIWYPYIQISFQNAGFPQIPDWQAYITLMLLFEKLAGRLVDALFFVKFGIKPEPGKSDNA